MELHTAVNESRVLVLGESAVVVVAGMRPVPSGGSWGAAGMLLKHGCKFELRPRLQA